MDVLPSSLLKLIVNERVNLPALADSSAVAVPVSFAGTVRQNDTRRLAGIHYILKLEVGDAAFGDHIGRKIVAVSDVGRLFCGATSYVA